MVKKIAAFDVFGTSFGIVHAYCHVSLKLMPLPGFASVISALDEEFGPELKKAGTTPAHVFMSWFADFSWTRWSDS
jgi:2-haloacid dehalogenase